MKEKTTLLHVHRLPVSKTDAELQKLFEGVGRVVNCDVVTDGTTQMSKAIGFVEMAPVTGPRKACSKMLSWPLDLRHGYPFDS